MDGYNVVSLAASADSRDCSVNVETTLLALPNICRQTRPLEVKTGEFGRSRSNSFIQTARGLVEEVKSDKVRKRQWCPSTGRGFPFWPILSPAAAIHAAICIYAKSTSCPEIIRSRKRLVFDWTLHFGWKCLVAGRDNTRSSRATSGPTWMYPIRNPAGG